jgi:hypothetical protein
MQLYVCVKVSAISHSYEVKPYNFCYVNFEGTQSHGFYVNEE